MLMISSFVLYAYQYAKRRVFGEPKTKRFKTLDDGRVVEEKGKIITIYLSTLLLEQFH